MMREDPKEVIVSVKMSEEIYQEMIPYLEKKGLEVVDVEEVEEEVPQKEGQKRSQARKKPPK